MEMDEKKYQEIYEKYRKYEQDAHERNQKRIRVGLKVNIFLPMIFLIVSFITESSKLIFLILWIVSLFGIAFYLMYIEFTDYKMQERILEFDPEAKGDADPNSLIGGRIVESGDQAADKINAIDNHIEEKKQEVVDIIETKVDNLKQVAQDKIAERRKEDKDNA
ncbi:MAG: hypothetical protein K6G05_04860 [Lachnospiraceae bacterium]|nr:hypothetical protein [Lachnospiraceae bacterium]